MASASDLRWNIRHNFDLVLAEVARWPFLTALVVVFYAAAAAVGYAQEYDLSAIEMTLALTGIVAGVIGLKILLMLMLYPLTQKSRFPGSYVVACFIAFVPIFVFYASTMVLLVRDKHESPPSLLLVPFGLFAYVLFSLVFGGALYANQSLLLRWRRNRDTN